VVLCAVLAVLLAQIPTPSPTPQASRFTPPAGWTSFAAKQVQSLAPNATIVGWWELGSDIHTQRINLTTAPSVGLSTDDFVTLRMRLSENQYRDRQVTSSTPTPLCDGAEGRTLVYRWGARMDMETTTHQLFAVSGETAYIATYEHRSVDPDSPIALASLMSLCPPPAARIAGLPPSRAPLTPPAGWMANSPGAAYTLTHPGGPRVWTWIGTPPGSNGHSEVLEALMLPQPRRASIQEDQVVASFEDGISKWASDVVVLERTRVALCRSTGVSLRMRATVQSQVMDIDAVLSPGTPKTYGAFYMRLTGTNADPDAMKAIQSLCL
jgi:hypothetical protein